NVSVFTGQSKPGVGTPVVATMDLDASVLGGTPEVLTVKLTDTDFPAPFNATGKFNSFIGGTKTSGVTATFQGFADPSNTEFGTAGATVCTPGLQTANGTPFESTVTDVPCALSGPFSMTMVLTTTLGPQLHLGF